jgi:hypothetical protein
MTDLTNLDIGSFPVYFIYSDKEQIEVFPVTSSIVEMIDGETKFIVNSSKTSLDIKNLISQIYELCKITLICTNYGIPRTADEIFLTNAISDSETIEMIVRIYIIERDEIKSVRSIEVSDIDIADRSIYLSNKSIPASLNNLKQRRT